ncbi:NF-kappa-B inhibitor delta [Chanos chanos]|uniref:NF-kappa-B inhibitor delta n=1 Tax=Chanos chanos TaxID=29144 RepID=A0A6J2W452_CHACN|nr:NF-kappa-B inhibitor delta [Chanos chanos]
MKNKTSICLHIGAEVLHALNPDEASLITRVSEYASLEQSRKKCGFALSVTETPKEKSCYTLPTVKKLLEQKRKRETSSASPSCSATPPTTAAPVANPVISEMSVSVPLGATSSYSDMGAVGYDRWDIPSMAPSNLQPCGPFSPFGTNFISSPSTSVNFSQSPLPNQPMPSSYSPQQLQDCQDNQLPQHYTPDCPVTAAMPVMTHAMPIPTSSYDWTCNQEYRSPIDTAKLEEARLFLQSMDYNRTTWQDDDGDTILHIYTAKGLREYAFAAAEKLHRLGSLDSKEHKGKTALLVAVTANQPEIVQDLLSFGADINACDVKGQTALHLAATYGFPRVMEVILSMGLRVDLEARNFEGLTPLHCVVISHSATVKALAAAASSTWHGPGNLQTQAEDKLSCLQLLLNAGASLLSQEIKSNKTALHLAVKEGNIQLVRYLLSIQLPDMQSFVNMKAHGHTALHMAAGLHGNPHQEELIRLLLSRGADPSIRNLENDQPAHLLQSGERGEQLKLILKKRSTSSRRRIMSLQDQE